MYFILYNTHNCWTGSRCLCLYDDAILITYPQIHFFMERRVKLLLRSDTATNRPGLDFNVLVCMEKKNIYFQGICKVLTELFLAFQEKKVSGIHQVYT